MTDTPVLDLLASMTADSLEASSLDPETLMLVRIAALVAVDAAPISYVANLEVVSDLEIDPDQVRGVLAAVAPIVGTARIVSALSKIAERSSSSSRPQRPRRSQEHEPEDAGGAGLRPFRPPTTRRRTETKEDSWIVTISCSWSVRTPMRVQRPRTSRR